MRRRASFQLELASNRHGKQTDNVPYGLDLSFLSPNPTKPYLFFERTRNMLDVVSHEMAGWRAALDRRAGTDLLFALLGARPHHRLPGREPHGDRRFSFERRRGIAGHALGLRGHRRRQRDALSVACSARSEEYERLKEFSENIVESIHVGILAADLEDRVESWNSQIEKLTGISRSDAVGPEARANCCRRICAMSWNRRATTPASTTSTSSCCARRPNGRVR